MHQTWAFAAVILGSIAIVLSAPITVRGDRAQPQAMSRLIRRAPMERPSKLRKVGSPKSDLTHAPFTLSHDRAPALDLPIHSLGADASDGSVVTSSQGAGDLAAHREPGSLPVAPPFSTTEPNLPDYTDNFRNFLEKPGNTYSAPNFEAPPSAKVGSLPGAAAVDAPHSDLTAPLGTASSATRTSATRMSQDLAPGSGVKATGPFVWHYTGDPTRYIGDPNKNMPSVAVDTPTTAHYAVSNLNAGPATPDGIHEPPVDTPIGNVYVGAVVAPGDGWTWHEGAKRPYNTAPKALSRVETDSARAFDKHFSKVVSRKLRTAMNNVLAKAGLVDGDGFATADGEKVERSLENYLMKSREQWKYPIDELVVHLERISYDPVSRLLHIVNP